MSLKKVYRLAFRIEGEMWNCYVAKNDTMNNAILIGSIRISMIEKSDDRKREFMELMKAGFSDFATELFGAPPTAFDEKPAPEHERSGSA